MFKKLYTYKLDYLFSLLILLISVPFSLEGDVTLSTISAGICGALFAVLLLSDMNKKIVCLVPFISALAAFFVTSDGFAAALALSFVPVGLAIAYSVVKTKTMSQAVTYSAIALIAYLVLIYFSNIIYLYGSLNSDTIKEYLNSFLAKVSQTLHESNDRLVTPEGTKMFSDEDINTLFVTFKFSFIGMYISGIMIATFFSNLIFKKAIKNVQSDTKEIKNAKERKFVLSKQAGIAYILLYIIMAFSGVSEAYMILAVQMLIYPIKIGLIYTGATYLYDTVKTRIMPIGSLAFTFIFFFILSGSFADAIISLMTLYGLITSLRKKTFRTS